MSDLLAAKLRLLSAEASIAAKAAELRVGGPDILSDAFRRVEALAAECRELLAARETRHG